MDKHTDNDADNSSAKSPAEKAPPNPKYGTGIFRRRIRLSKGEGFVKGELEDSSHAFKTTLHYDQSGITDVTAEAIRYPMTTCPGAVQPLREFIGLPLNLLSGEITKRINPRLQCTHLFDLTVLAYAHIARDEQQRVYDVELPDDDGSEQGFPLQVYQNGKLVLSWAVKQWKVLEPKELAGNTLGGGFSKWVAQAFTGNEEQKEWAWLAQKGNLVSEARTFDVNKLAGTRSFTGEHMVGICHTYSEAEIAKAIHSENSFIDFSDSAEDLLLFKAVE